LDFKDFVPPPREGGRGRRRRGREVKKEGKKQTH
jgi:hypothetical protein